jgi:G3E family GTPase
MRASAASLPPSREILFTVVGGYLGSGKTTLLNQILRHAGERRIGIVVNDFGGINIDASLIDRRGDEVVSLANGCVCCSISAGFAEALARLAHRTKPPEHVIIEASGVADPVRVGYFGSMPPYRLDGVVVLADAETIRARVRDKYVGSAVLRQLRSADLIVLNKVDLVSEAGRTALGTWLSEQVPGARVFPTSQGRVPLAVLLGLHEAGAPGESDDGKHDHGEEYASLSVTMDTPLGEVAFRASVAEWPGSVLRAKGIVYLADDKLHRYVFQLVGRRWSLTQDRLWRSDPPRTELVLIGLACQLDGERMLAGLEAAKAGA